MAVRLDDVRGMTCAAVQDVPAVAMRERNRAFVSMVGMSFAGNLIFCMLPLLIGAMVDELGFSPREAGLVAAVELAVFACGSLACVRAVQVLSRRRLGMVGIGLIVLGGVGCALSRHLLSLMAARCCMSFGCALCMSVFYATGATQPHPVRTFGYVNGLSIWYGAAYLVIGPLILSSWGLAGAYLSLTLVALALLPTCWLIPEKPQAFGAGARRARRSSWGERIQGLRESLRHRSMWLGAAVLICFLLLYLAHSAIWVYQERIGVQNHIGPQSIGLILAQAMAAWGALGSFAAGVLGEARGRVLPQVVSFGLSIAAVLLLVYGRGMPMFAASCSLIVLTWFFGMPYILALMSNLDPTGRLSVLGGAAWPIGGACGSAISAVLVATSGYETMGWFVAGVYTVALLLVIPVALHFDRQARVG